MVVPASEPPPLEVVEAEFASHLLIRLLGPVAFLVCAHDTLLGHLRPDLRLVGAGRDRFDEIRQQWANLTMYKALEEMRHSGLA